MGSKDCTFRDLPEGAGESNDLIGESQAIIRLREQMRQVAVTDANVLITGESGSGKELVAKGVHHLSARNQQPFVPINCGAIPRELLESELFGHVKGAFTGAITSRSGRFELAENGTLFLDEIGEMSCHMQVKLLRVIQERKYERVGSEITNNTNIRIIAATHRNLDEAIKDNSFREDLYYRLNVFPIAIPPLRDRIEDIPILIREFCSRIEISRNCTLEFSDSALNSLLNYRWPGNVRELQNLVERLSILHPDSTIEYRHLPQKYQVACVREYPASGENPVSVEGNAGAHELPVDGLDLKDHLQQIEVALISQSLLRAHGVVSRAAKLLGLRRTTLVEKLKKYEGLNQLLSQKIDIMDNAA